MADVIEIFADGTRVERDFTEAELNQIEKDKADVTARLLKEEERAIQRQAVLDRLGLSADEARLILG